MFSYTSHKGHHQSLLVVKKRNLSSSYRGQPRFRVPAHVAAFTVLLLPAFAIFAYSERYGPSEEELEHELQERYAPEIRLAKENNKKMAEFFDHAIRARDGKVDDKLEEMIRAGKGGKKRMYAVDEKLYGTAEGVSERKRMEEKLKKEKEEKRKLKDKKEPRFTMPALPQVDKTQAATVAAVAALAAVVGFLAGGNRRS